MISFILNLPYTLVGILMGILSVPNGFEIKRQVSYALILHVRSFWWAVGYMKGTRAATIGHTVLIGVQSQTGDLEHELVHVEQNHRRPLIQPILYYIELFRKGYRNNKYEEEAYRVAGNVYRDK